MVTTGTDGWQLHHEGVGAGTPILGIHGSPSASTFWVDAARELARLGRVILYDRRGFGRSVPPSLLRTLDLADHVADAAELLRTVAGAPAGVIGRSTGGLVALALAIEHPRLVRALVLLEPAVFGIDHQARRWADGVRSAVLSAAVRDEAAAARAMFDHALGPDLWNQLPAEAREVLAAGSPALLAEMRGRGLDLSAEPFAPTAPQLASIDVPVLVVSADSSFEHARTVDEQLASGIPGARHEVVEGGHLIDPAHPVVLRFLEDVLGAQPSDGGA